MQEDDVRLFLQGVLSEVFNRSDIEVTPSLAAKDVIGWDSIKQVEIVLALEEHYNIRIRTKDLIDVANVGDLIALVLAKVRAQ